MPGLVKAFDFDMLEATLAVAEKPVLLYVSDCSQTGFRQTLEMLGELSRSDKGFYCGWLDSLGCVQKLSSLGLEPPLILLVQPSQPLSMLANPTSGDQIERWLRSRGFASKTGQWPNDRWRAFYGDSQLRDFFYQRLNWHARAGRIEICNEPVWENGQGTISAAMVHNADPRLFERLTGMPYAFACLLEFMDVVSSEQVDQLFNALQPGTQLDGAAIHVFGAWLGSEELPWKDLINDRRVDRLRQDWLDLDARRRQGQTVAAQTWQSLRTAARGMTLGDDPHRTLQRNIAKLIMVASPPPDDRDHVAWRQLFFDVGNYAKVSMVRYLHGWRHYDFAMETLLFRWFSEREAKEPGGRFTPESLLQAQREWEAQPKDREYIEREKTFHANAREWLMAFNQRWWCYLLDWLNEAPV